MEEQAVSPQREEFDFEMWIRILCSQTGTDKEQIPSEVLELLKAQRTKNDVNRLFFSWREQFAKARQEEITDELKKKLAGVINIKDHKEYRQATYTISLIERDITSYHNLITQKLRSITEHRQIIQRLERQENMDLWPHIEEVLQDGWYVLDTENTLRALSGTDGDNEPSIYFITPEISISYFNREAGINKNVAMGSYKVRWQPLQNKLEVLEHVGNISAAGYYHPHVRSGDVCWGNAAETYVQAMRNLKPKDAMQALRVILQTYNADSPYQLLEAWERAREKDPDAGTPTEFREVHTPAWINQDFMPESWATQYEVSREEEEENGELVVRYLMKVFVKVYTRSGRIVPEFEGSYFIRTRNGRNYQVEECDLEWEE